MGVGVIWSWKVIQNVGLMSSMDIGPERGWTARCPRCGVLESDVLLRVVYVRVLFMKIECLCTGLMLMNCICLVGEDCFNMFRIPSYCSTFLLLWTSLGSKIVWFHHDVDLDACPFWARSRSSTGLVVVRGWV